MVDGLPESAWEDISLCEQATLVRHHRGKQGQEIAFKGPLGDLDLPHPPYRKLLANQAFYACGQLAQMLLRSLIQYFIRMVARLIHASGRWRLDFAKSNSCIAWIYSAAVQLE